MRLRKTLLAAACVGALVGICAAPTVAQAEVGIFFNVAPPEPRYEVVPEPRAGYVWSAGYWDLRGDHHVWRPGHWERHRRGYYLDPPTWVQQGDRWELRRGRWNRGDRDGDGVPNRMDRAPDNPYRN